MTQDKGVSASFIVIPHAHSHFVSSTSLLNAPSSHFYPRPLLPHPEVPPQFRLAQESRWLLPSEPLVIGGSLLVPTFPTSHADRFLVPNRRHFGLQWCGRYNEFRSIEQQQQPQPAKFRFLFGQISSRWKRFCRAVLASRKLRQPDKEFFLAAQGEKGKIQTVQPHPQAKNTALRKPIVPQHLVHLRHLSPCFQHSGACPGETTRKPWPHCKPRR